VNVILSTFFIVYSVIGLVALGAVGVLATIVVPRFPHLSASEVHTAQWVVAILGLRTVIALPMSVFGAVTTARQRFALTGWIAIVMALLQAAATYAVLSRGYGLITLVLASSGLGVASYGAYALAARRAFPRLRLSPSRFSGRQVREVTAFSLYLFLISIAIHVAVNVDNMIIGAYLGTSAIAVYTVAVRLSEYQRQLCGQFTGLLFPLVVRFEANRDDASLRTTLLDGTRIAFGLVVGVTICLVAFGGPVVTLWMGPGFGDSMAPLYVLAIAGVVMVAQGPAGNLLLAMGHHRLVAAASVLDIVLNVGLSLALVPAWGLAGVAVGTALPYVALNVGVLIPLACHRVGLSLGQFTRAVAGPTLVAAVPAVGAAMAIRAATAPASLSAVLGLAGLVGLVFIVMFCGVGLRPADRTRYLGSLRRFALDLAATRVATS
jgi:O-antigen/teichoic acid export membrane protein